MAHVEYGEPGIAGVKSLQYLGEDTPELTPAKVGGGVLIAYGVWQLLRSGLSTAVGGAALVVGYRLWQR